MVHILIIEGRLEAVHVVTDGGFTPACFPRRLLLVAQPVLNLRELEQRLYLFQQDSRIDKLSAELKPGQQPGRSILEVQVKEHDSVSSYVEINSHHTPPSVPKACISTGETAISTVTARYCLWVWTKPQG